VAAGVHHGRRSHTDEWADIACGIHKLAEANRLTAQWIGTAGLVILTPAQSCNFCKKGDRDFVTATSSRRWKAAALNCACASAFPLTSSGAARQSKSGAVVARHSDGHNLLKSGVPQSMASSQAFASLIDNASALALSAESWRSPKSLVLVRPILFLHQVMCRVR
jgi:hypothetical protein